jgi:hypothetical protein
VTRRKKTSPRGFIIVAVPPTAMMSASPRIARYPMPIAWFADAQAAVTVAFMPEKRYFVAISDAGRCDTPHEDSDARLTVPR